MPEMQAIAFDVAVTIRITKREYSGEMMSRGEKKKLIHREDEDKSKENAKTKGERQVTEVV